MTDIDGIVAALTTGAAAGLSNTATAAVQDAYHGVREAVRKLLARHGDGGEEVLAELDQPNIDSADTRERLRTALAEAGADRDDEITAALHRLTTLTAPTTNIAISSQGVIFGDGNSQTNHF